MAWRLAKSLEALRTQINALSPNRSKISDGTIGDAAHATRSSDHNPWVKDGKTGVVTALDITHDPGHGVGGRSIANAIARSRDGRVKYIISDGEIMSGGDGPQPWVWRPYKGKNAHRHHVHMSVKSAKASYDDTRPWRLEMTPNSEPPVRPENPVLSLGAKGADVERLQELLIAAGAEIVADADFGDRTKAAVKAFQKKHGLVPDGVVGPNTWDALGAVV